MWEWDIFTNARILWLQAKYKGKLQLKLFPFVPSRQWESSLHEQQNSIGEPENFEFIYLLEFLPWVFYQKTISDLSQFWIMAFYEFRPRYKKRSIPGSRGWAINVISRCEEAEKCNCGVSINISGLMDGLWLTALQHGTCNQKYDLFHNKISEFVFWRNCYWRPWNLYQRQT